MILKRIRFKFIEFFHSISFIFFISFNYQTYLLIKKNRKFKNIHFGKRCFIIGNGPSINEQNLETLSDEITFTVNQASRHKDFNKLKTNYHFWADPQFFDLDVHNPEDFELLEIFKTINTKNNKPECFLPIEQVSFVKKFKLDSILKIYYFRSKLPFYNNYHKKIDFSKNIPGFGTVVQWAIIMAIYMGFKEIYLLGCDNTGIIGNIKSFLNENDQNDYSYFLSNNEKIRMNKNIIKKTNK
jgi:hypothetical protein